MKILPQIYLWIRKNLLSFGSIHFQIQIPEFLEGFFNVVRWGVFPQFGQKN